MCNTNSTHIRWTFQIFIRNTSCHCETLNLSKPTTFGKARWKTYKSSLGTIRWIPRLPNTKRELRGLTGPQKTYPKRQKTWASIWKIIGNNDWIMGNNDFSISTGPTCRMSESTLQNRTFQTEKTRQNLACDFNLFTLDLRPRVGRTG